MALTDLSPFTVLNVNDSEPSRYLTSRILRSVGFQILEAATGLEALRVAAEKKPHVVVLDVRLPDVDGLEVCRRLKSDPATASIAVLHTSATYVTYGKRVAGLEAGADGYLAQPFEAVELIATVKSLLRMRLAEQEARQHAAQLEEMDRRKDEYLAMLAHELRNPLAASSMSLSILETMEARSPREQKLREVLRRQTQNLIRLVDDLLDVARVTRGKIELQPEPLDLAKLLQEVVAAAQPVAEARGQRLLLELAAGPVTLHGDPTRVEQIFANLVDNATKYSNPGGTVTVALAVEPREVEVRITDTGIGMDAVGLSTIFELFSQLDNTLARKRGGLGIGLTVVKALVEMHGGTVAAESRGPGQGSTFRVRLPRGLAAAAGAGARLGAGPVEAPGRPARRVALIEDNLDAREALHHLVQSWGFSVRTAAEGLAGAELLLEWTPDVAIIDLGLPGIDGLELARRVRATPAGRAIRLLALTGYGSPAHRAQALAAGFEAVLVKPAEPARVLEALQGVERGQVAGSA